LSAKDTKVKGEKWAFKAKVLCFTPENTHNSKTLITYIYKRVYE